LPLKSFDFTWGHDKLQKDHMDLLHSFHTLESLILSYAMDKQLADGSFCFSGNQDRDILLADETVQSILEILKNNPNLKYFEMKGGIWYWPDFQNPDPEVLDRMMSKPMQEKFSKYIQGIYSMLLLKI
jgi:hypothetical protein